MIDGIANRPLYFYQKDIIVHHGCLSKQWSRGILPGEEEEAPECRICGGGAEERWGRGIVFWAVYSPGNVKNGENDDEPNGNLRIAMDSLFFRESHMLFSGSWLLWLLWLWDSWLLWLLFSWFLGVCCFWLFGLLRFMFSLQYAATIVQTTRKTSIRKNEGIMIILNKKGKIQQSNL